MQINHADFIAHIFRCSFVQYYLIDVAVVFITLIALATVIIRRTLRIDGNTKVFNGLLKPVHIKDKVF